MTIHTAAEIEQEAIAWLLRLDARGELDQPPPELKSWLAADPRCAGAFLQARATWSLLDRIGDEPAIDGPLAVNDDDLAPPSRRRFLAFLGTGASLVAAGLGTFWFLPREEIIKTRVGEVRPVTLGDGSHVAINTASTIGLAFEKKTRRVRLRSGEAWFHVAKDPERPFVVEAGPARVEAVGTAFSVRLRGDGVDVLVTEGVVAAWMVDTPDRRLRISAGERAFLGDRRVVKAEQVSVPELDRQLAWREGKVDFSGETVATAVEEFNRYNAQRIVLTDKAIADERFYGVFRIDDPEGFAMALHTGFDVPVSADGTVMVIGPKPAE